MKELLIQHFPVLSYAGQEAINALCTNLSFTGEKIRRIMITSSHAEEGKSFLAMSLMRTLARNGKRVALVDADLRRSGIAAGYALSCPEDRNMPGLAHLLAGMAEEEDVIYRTGIRCAWMVPAGRVVSNPLPLLNSRRFGALLEHLAERMDYVLVDAPPVGTVIDAAEIAKSCDGTLLVVRHNAVRRHELVETAAQLEQTGCPILGAVLNMVEPERCPSYDAYYGRSNQRKRGCLSRRRRK